MNININIHHHESNPSHVDMERIFSLLNTIQMTEQEVLDRIEASNSKAEKNKAEVIAVVAELKDAIAKQAILIKC